MFYCYTSCNIQAIVYINWRALAGFKFNIHGQKKKTGALGGFKLNIHGQN